MELIETIRAVHSYFAYVVLLVLVLAVVNAIGGFFSKRDFNLEKDFRVSLFALILSHLQLVIGLALYFTSSNGFTAVKALGMSGLNSASRLLAVEHPFINILAIVCITIGWSKHKKVLEATKKFKLISIFYGLGLLLILSRIPWGQWFS